MGLRSSALAHKRVERHLRARYRPGDMSPTHLGWGAAAVLLGALAARLLFVFTIGNVPELHGDENYYVSKARELVASGQYPGAFRPPGQSTLIAIAFVLLNETLPAARLLQIVPSLLIVALVIDTTRRQYGSRAGLIAGMVAALHPTLVSYAGFLWSETLYGALLLLNIWLLDRFRTDHRLAWMVAAGIALGCSALTRETGLYLLPVLMVWVATATPTRWPTATMLLVLSTFSIAAPWMIRNYSRYDMASISTNRWRVIAYGNAREAIEEIRSRPDDARPHGIVARERAARDLAIQEIAAQQPWWIAHKVVTSTTRLLAGKTQLARFVKKRWFAPQYRRIARLLVTAETITTVATLALGIVGLWLSRGGALKSLVVVVLAYHWAVYVVTFANPRFLMPLLPLVSIYVGALFGPTVLSTRRPAYAYIGACISLAVYGLIVAYGPL